MTNDTGRVLTFDKKVIDGHIYTIVIDSKLKQAFILYNSSDIKGDLYRVGYKFNYYLSRDRELKEDLAGLYIKHQLDHLGLILPDKNFRVVQIPFDALFEGGLRE